MNNTGIVLACASRSFVTGGDCARLVCETNNRSIAMDTTLLAAPALRAAETKPNWRRRTPLSPKMTPGTDGLNGAS